MHRRSSAILRTASAALVLTGLCTPRAPGQYDREAVETDSAVLEKLERWRDLKFGFMMHWGAYSQWGIVESWSLCSEDVPWCKRHLDDYHEYCRQYENLIESFDPQRFDPAAWARAARAAGMKYVVFTTKHHDGFCLFDSAETDYSAAGPRCAFSADPRADVAKHVFDAFRGEEMWTGVYFSKADWHHPDYWAPEWAHPDRNVNYDPRRYPERWQRFCGFTYRQIEELMTGYGPVDILWLDGGWVRPAASIDEESREWLGPRGWVQDIDMPRIATMARRHQPGLIVVDRTVGGRYENYRTPEQRVPPEPLDGPWETCMTMGDSWSYTPGDRYKPTRRLIHLLVDIVAKGGNFLLNVGPDPQGELPPEAVQRMREIGAWLAVNGTAIYGTRPIAPFKEVNTCFTRQKDGAVNAIYLAREGEDAPPARIMLHGLRPAPETEVRLLGFDGTLGWERVGSGALIEIPKEVRERPPCGHAWTLRLSQIAE